MKKIFLSLFMMSIYITFYAQTNGYVYDSENIPIEGVNVYLADYKIMISTNDQGSFYFEDNLANNTNIHFHKYGYAAKIVQYKKGVDLIIELEKLHISLDEIGVTESHNELGNSKVTNIEKKSLGNVFLNSNSMLESVTELSGVDMISSGIGIQKIVVRGLSGMRVVTYLNGMQINNQQWANDHGIGFTSLGLNEVELIKGASALRYGSEAIGGLLYFKDQPFIRSEKMQGFISTKFNYSSFLNSSQFGVKWNNKNLFFNIYGEYSISSDYRLPNNKYLFNSRFNQNAMKFSIAHKTENFQNIIRYHLHNESPGIPAHVHGDPQTVNLSALLSSNIDLSTDFQVTRPNQFVTNQLFTYESNYFTNNLKLSLHLGHFINRLQEYEKWTLPAFDLSLSNTQINPHLRYSSSNFSFEFGSQISIMNNKNKINDRLVPDASSFNIGPYIILNYEKNNLGFNSGLRYDHKRVESEDQTFDIDYSNLFSTPSFSSGIYYRVNEHITRLTYSGAFRSPHFSELFSDGVHHGTNRYEIGNENLDIEYANQFDLKYQWSNHHLGFVLNPFAQYISNFISINPTDSFSNIYRVYNYIQYKHVEIKGIEMNLHYHPHQLHNLHLEQAYSFLHTNNKDDSYGLALTPANSIKTKILFSLKEYNKYKLDHVSIYHIHKFQQNSYAEYEELTESYNLINLKLGGEFNDQFKYILIVNNLFNQEYTPHVSRLRGVAGGVPHPGRYFSVNLKYEF